MAIRSPLALAPAVLLAVACGPSTPPRIETTVTAKTAPSPSTPFFDPRCVAVDAPAPKPASHRRSWGEERVSTSPDPANACYVADDNLAKAEARIAQAVVHPAKSETFTPWDRVSKPLYLDLVSARFALDGKERAALAKNGFAVPARLEVDAPTWAFHEIHQSQLPLYVSIDAVLHAIFAGNDDAIVGIEEQSLVPALDRALLAMHCALPTAASDYPEDTARDLDLYLSVARSLLAGKPVPSALGTGSQAGAFVAKATAADTFEKGISLFGRERTLDFTQMQPRGHYTQSALLSRYFRASMWLARVELNLVSRSCRSSAPDPAADPRETPREALDALALADLADRADALDDIAILDRAWGTLAGRREDVSLRDLAKLRLQAGIDSLLAKDAPERLRKVIGDRFRRTTRLHYMPAGTTELPAIATFLGPRVVPDSTALMQVTEPRVAERENVYAADVAYALGHDRAKRHLGAQLAKYPDLERGLDEARKVLAAPLAGEDLLGAWLLAIRGLSEPQAGVLPSFMKGEAFADLRMNSAIVGYAQLRHNFVLMAGEPYFQGGCEIPDAWVEPAPATYDALVSYADRLAALESAIHPEPEARDPHPARLGAVLRTLRSIQQDELAGRRLTAAQRQWLAMVVEMLPATTAGPPTNTGWYFDLFPSRARAFDRAAFVADYFTGTSVSYAGAAGVRYGIFVVDVGGPPRVMVGPISRGYEHHSKNNASKRLDDAAALALPETEREHPWAASYTVGTVAPEPSLSLRMDFGDGPYTLVVEAPARVGNMTIELLDHHRRRVRSATRFVDKGVTKFTFTLPKDLQRLEGAHVQVGAFHDWILWGYSLGPFKQYGATATGP